MSFITAKEQRVEKAWNRRGLSGLRTELLLKVADITAEEFDDESTVLHIANCVYGTLPKREWPNAPLYIRETCGLLGINVDTEEYRAVIMRMMLSEETLREDIGDE